MFKFPTVWEPYNPDTLVDACIKFCLQNLCTLCNYDPTSTEYYLRDGVNLPSEICERIVHLYAENLDQVIDDKFLKLFKDPDTTRLVHVNLHDSSITDEGLAIVTQHMLVELDISNCSKITRRSLENINNLKSELLSLTVGSSVQIFPESLQSAVDEIYPVRDYTYRGYILRAPKLRKLVIKGLEIRHEPEYFGFLLKSFKHLTHLDLSSCDNLGDFSYLTRMKNLMFLTLYDVPRLQDAIDTLKKLTSLRHLDISQSSDKYGHYKHPNATLRQLVEKLPKLVSLDLSGTNLAGSGIQERDSPDEDKGESSETKSQSSDSQDFSYNDVPGLKSRVNRPLEFLGLFNSAHEACFRRYIPAIRVAGDANEQQVLVAAQMYCDRPAFLQKVLNDLFHLFRYETCNDPRKALDVVLVAMQKHLGEKYIQIAGSASLFYIVKSDEKTSFTIDIKRKIVKTLLDAMCMHRYETTMLRNGCLTLIHFKIPQDVLFDYVRLVDILLYVVSQEDQDDFVQRIGIYLINSLACQVDGIQKHLVGERGAVSIMLRLIEARMTRLLCDEVMETAWSTMWNVTDETPTNCKKFLDERGMELFLGCLKMFPDKPELLRNMMGLLGNVAEVQELRQFLMKDEYLTVFCELLDSSGDGIEVSYNAAGILSHLASDGPETWAEHGILTIKRQEMLDRMVAAITRWKLNTTRNINYRSFEPILRLLSVSNTPEAQHWAVWALANLTRVYPEKYCGLLKEENGLEMLDELIKSQTPYFKIKELARIIKDQCERYFTCGSLESPID